MVYRGKPSTGCQNCRTRRIKCDETRPHCRACVRTNRSCPGYLDPFDVMLRDQVAFKRKKRDTHVLNAAPASPAKLASLTTSVIAAAPETAVSTNVTRADWMDIVFDKTCNIPKSVNLPLEDTVASLFFSSYLYSPKDPLIREGFMEMVPHAYANAQPGSHLKLITLAVSFFSVSAWTGNRSYLRTAEHLCVQAISKTREAIQGGIDRNQDETLMTVLLLLIYEELSAMKERRAPGKTHLRGAIALINSRSQDQRETDLSITLENAVHAQLIKTTKGLAYPVMQTPKVWPPAPVAPESASTQLLMATSDLVSLRQAWDKLVLDQPAANVTELEEILARARHLDTKLVAWTHALPSHWHPVSATMISDSIRKAGMYKNRCDCYADIWIASTWNFYRDSRIVIQNIILDCLRLLPPPLRADDIQSALDIIQDLATGICATIPYFLGSQSKPAQMGMEKIDYPEADARRVTAGHRQTSPLLGGWLASTNLFNMTMLPLTDELHAWILEQKHRVLRIYTFGSMEGVQ
ncbi:hypothetical protein ASPACDRAFT_60764 [Aspergillus aculeatus ATCC 16872]|uniref:Zn(2)-C6 fungal-type domain-containing protein n=1 Tax=Aspergillus aculeatus (strain ATCC 16872 / CBS 172.66 / WB 5094) TaxID=690307 RepID=A0A1L9WUY2_ASPA1|nr:uncharacterized protein ASPACDRAFT_60764 [Aspergillus aculeatus ATCC 16872]OJJ99948.1 hypothetical protein ASPACDRAFT_60764 [Aspergillus aculeatus ATCC 16872]